MWNVAYSSRGSRIEALPSDFSHGAVSEMWRHCGKFALDKATLSVWGAQCDDERAHADASWPESRNLECEDVMQCARAYCTVFLTQKRCWSRIDPLKEYTRVIRRPI